MIKIAEKGFARRQLPLQDCFFLLQPGALPLKTFEVPLSRQEYPRYTKHQSADNEQPTWVETESGR